MATSPSKLCPEAEKLLVNGSLMLRRTGSFGCERMERITALISFLKVPQLAHNHQTLFCVCSPTVKLILGLKWILSFIRQWHGRGWTSNVVVWWWQPTASPRYFSGALLSGFISIFSLCDLPFFLIDLSFLIQAHFYFSSPFSLVVNQFPVTSLSFQ